MMQSKIIASLTAEDKKNLQLIKALLIEKPEQHLSIEGLSKQTGLNRMKLTYGFKFLFGISIYQFLVNRRIVTAVDYLTTTSLPIKAIARQCGYKTTQHFITAFKKTKGMTPGKYRQSLLNN
jgi:AraC family transcriptional activator of pyochelin receptor